MFKLKNTFCFVLKSVYVPFLKAQCAMHWAPLGYVLLQSDVFLDGCDVSCRTW